MGATKGLDDADYEVVYYHWACLGGTGIACGSLIWYPANGAANTVTVSLDATADTEIDCDRTAYVWAMRVVYLDTTTEAVLAASEWADPSAASYWSVTSGPPPAEGLAQDTTDWQVSDYLDGVMVTHDVSTSDYDGEGFELLMENTCDYLHDTTPSVRCTVDVRGKVDDPAHYPFDLDALHHRMLQGEKHGDGIVAGYLPMSLDDIGQDRGRFAAREVLDDDQDIMLYEPRMTRSVIGEVHEWEAEVPTGCGGTYTVDWSMGAELGVIHPEFRWYVSLWDESESGWLVQKLARATAETEDTGDTGYNPDCPEGTDGDCPNRLPTQAGDLLTRAPASGQRATGYGSKNGLLTNVSAGAVSGFHRVGARTRWLADKCLPKPVVRGP